MANINSVITYNANLSPAQAQIKALTGQVGALSAAFNTLDKSALSAQRSLAATFAANVGQIGGFTAQTVKATDSVTNFGKQIAANRLTMREYFREAFTGYARQNSMLRQLAAQQVRFEQSIAVPTGAGQAMLMTPQSINAASSAAQLASQRFSIFNQLVNGGATAMLNWGKNTQWAGRQLMVGFTLPLALFAGVMSKQFRELDKELTRFQKVYGSDLGNAVSESTQKMREQVQQLAYDISESYGIAAKETAALAADIAATGAEGEQLMASIQQTTRLAVLGEVDRQEAMKATLSLQSAFRLNTNELAESINFLNAVENQTSATLEDLATAIPKVGPVIRSLGGDVKDLATLLVAMREGGIPAAEAANALKSGLASLINPTKQASEVAKQFGVDLVGIVEANRGQLMPTIYAVQEALNGLDSFSRSRIIEQIFGKYQFARISALFDNIGRTGSQTQQVIELATRSSAELAAVANGEIRTLTESTAVKFQRTLEQLKNALMPIGQALTETLIPVFEKVGQGLKAFSTFFSALPDSIQGLAKWAVALTAIAGPVIMLVGLFGNLIANGLKFGMMIVRLGAKISGLKTEKFQLLDEQVMAARLGVDNLTSAFTTQEVALNRLVGVIGAYEASLRRLSTSNPALFIPGAVPARGALPIKRQTGSTRPEFVPGSGRGDKIPAMLEPGEFIVNRAATEKYAPVLMQMNRGTLPGFQEGTQLSHLYTAKTQSVGSLLQLPFLDQGARAMLMLIQSIHGADFQVKTYTNAVVGLSTGLNQSMERGQASIEIFRREISDAGTAFDPLREQLRVMISETGEFNGDLNLAQQAVDSFAQQMRAQAAGFKGTTFNARQLEAMSMAALAGVSDPRQRAALMRLFETPTAFSAGKGLTASNMYMFGQASGIPMYSAGEGRSKRIYAQLGPEEYLGIRPRGERIPLGNMPTYQGAQISPLSIALPVGARTLSQPYSAPTMYTEEGQRITRSMASSMGGTQREVFMRQIEASAATFIDDLARAFVNTVARTLEAASPSRKADREMAVQGKNFGDGATQGFIRGYKSSAAGKPIIAGPVGGTGVESISNAQKIAQADQSILKMKTLQQKFTADRVRAEVELGALDARLIQIRNSETMTAQEKLRATLALNQERISLEKTHQTALANETRIQNIINGYKEKIASADQAQLRAEQEEARNAARRAAGSVGIGPGGGAGWLMGGISPYAIPAGGSRFGNLSPEERKQLAQLRRSGLDPSTSQRYQAGIERRFGREVTKTGPSVALSAARDSAEMRGGAVMNAAFMASMAMSSVAMLGGASSDAAAKIGLFSTALMTATMLMQSVSAKGMFTNFLGMGSLGTKMQAAGTGPATNLVTGAATKGSALFRAGSAVSMLGGPVGIAAGLGVTAAITGFMMYRNAANEARERAVAAFNDPVKSAEYFGETIMNVSDLLEKNRLSNISEDLQGVDQALRDAVSQDYAPLIEQIKFLSAGAGAQQLSVAYSNMILSGMSAENAKAAVEAIAAEAGVAGGEAFNEALSQGFLDELTTSEAVKRVVGQFNPSQAEYGDSGQSVLSMLTEELAKLEARREEIELLMSRGGRNQQLIAEYNSLADQIDALADRIEDLSTVNPDMISGVLDSLLLAYQQDPTAAIDGIKELSDTINSLEDEGDRIAALDKITQYLRDSYGEQWNIVGQSIDTANEKLVATQMLAAGLSLDRAVNSANEFDAALGQALVTAKLLADEAGRAASELQTELTDEIVADLESQRIDVETEIQNIEDANAKLVRGYNRRKREAVAAFEAEQESRQDNIDSMQDEMDQKRRIFDEEMQQLDDRKDAINKSSEAYIDSLEKTQKAESFYSQQRKTAFSALEKLASGDVFGFLQERQQMSQQAQEFSYDEMISGIEERRDLELDAIDEVREKKQREQDEYEQMMEDRIKAEQDLMDEQQKAHDAQMEHYEKQIKKAEREKEQKIAKKREEIEELNIMQETAARDILEFQKKYAKEYEKYDQYARQLENLKILRVQEIYFRGGVPLSVAANQAGIPASEVPDFLDRNRDEFAFQGTSPGGGGGLVIPSNSTVYISQELPGGPTGTQQVQDMTVDAQNVTINSNGGAPADWRGPGWNYDGTPDPDGNPQTGNGLRNGGKVIGPGGPKSDVIPAMLSNGEYVIQASSVNKYGTDLMHAINAGKFATGGFVTADRAEQNATGTRGRPKPQYSGGTPTYSSGYTGANTQAYSKPGVTRPKKINTPSFKEEVTSLVDSVRGGLATAFDSVATGFIPPWMRTSQNTTTSIGRFIGGSQYNNSNSITRALLAMGITPFGKGAAAPRQGLLPLTDSAGMPYRPSLSISPVQKGPAPGTVISIGRGIRGARGIAESGRFKNMFETDTTTGSAGFDDRAAIEHRGWGLPFNADPSTRPIYGLLRKEEDVVFPYGEFLFDIKYDPTKRTSYSPGDTKWFSPPEGGLPDLKQSHTPGKGNIDYAEVWQNNVKLSDVSRAHVAITDTMSDAQVSEILSVAQMLRVKGVPVTVHGLETNLPHGQWFHRRRGQMFLPGMEGINQYGDSLMANGGLVQKFAEGGLAAPDKGLFGILSQVKRKEKTYPSTAPGTPGTGLSGEPTSVQPTSTNLISHPSQGGPNRWPYSGYAQGSATVPGTSVRAHLNKDVLPLFLAFASDYHRLIRPINTLYGIGSRDGNYSNHPSGTAVDINPSQEGQYFGWGQSIAQKQAVLDWWRGRKSSLAPWDSKSPIPYRTMNALMDKYKILQWFGPKSLGGFIIDEMAHSDPMHVQITQSRVVSPGEVAQTISSLGINSDGTFNRPRNYAAGGFISGPGGPRSDMIPAMLSNGEYVVKASSVAKYGKGFMDQINAGQFGMGGLATTVPRMSSPAKYAGGGFVGSIPAATPTFGMPQMETINPSSMSANIANNYGGSNSSSVRNSNKVKVVINGAGGKSANAIANKVISMINQANGRRNHSRSAG